MKLGLTTKDVYDDGLVSIGAFPLISVVLALATLVIG